MSAPSPERLASFSARRPWLVVALWVVFLGAALVLAGRVGDALTTDGAVFTELESETGRNLIEERFGDDPVEEFVIVRAGENADSPAFTSLAQALIADLRALDGDVAGVVSYYETGDPGLVSAGGNILLIPVTLAGSPDDAAEHAEPLIEIVHEYDATAGFRVVTGGGGSIERTFTETSESDLRMAEIIGIPIALLVLVMVFGALAAAGLPIAVAFAAILAAVGATTVVGMQFELSFFVINMITMIGLAVGIDYSLLIIQRFREERRAGLGRDAAIARTGGTASRAVLFSGLAVMVALSGMLVIPDSVFRSLATGAILVVIAALAAAMTLLPAILRLLGDRVNAGSLRVPFRARREASSGRFWNAVTRFVMDHAVLSVTVTAALLIAATLPYFTIELGNSGVGSLPNGSDAREAFDVLDEEFSAGILAPTDVVVAADATDADAQSAIAELRAALAGDDAFGPSTVRVSPGGDVTVISAPVAGDPEGSVARDAIGRLRGTYIPAAFGSASDSVYVTGITAGTLDYAGMLNDYTPYVFALVLGLSFIILLVVFRSIVVPVKAIIMNMLSVGAAYGLLVLVFQHGVGAGLLGFQQTERIESWVPLFMFSVLFGLSMDYHVFLLSRIRERFLETGDNRESVAYGVKATAGLITGAAAIMVAVFAGFAMGDLVMFQQMGFGLAVAVLLDATIVRVVLVPASMALLGNANWYLPSWLDWLPHLDVEGEAEPPEKGAPGLSPAGAEA